MQFSEMHGTGRVKTLSNIYDEFFFWEKEDSKYASV